MESLQHLLMPQVLDIPWKSIKIVKHLTHLPHLVARSGSSHIVLTLLASAELSRQPAPPQLLLRSHTS